eukprot:CAMPEP_0171987092 /NCGR_PEP_ID=MMETSP0993-20121228/275212_1 /TAXON_ID=483369 /ORGANISM="non described non described, Strain CCMP2098" /LENGTH=138 /DNA_ID=CAMNT_0012640025 /DNA_START=108 /DNA_END=526 /DNA_ORIENTATION=+
MKNFDPARGSYDSTAGERPFKTSTWGRAAPSGVLGLLAPPLSSPSSPSSSPLAPLFEATAASAAPPPALFPVAEGFVAEANKPPARAPAAQGRSGRRRHLPPGGHGAGPIDKASSPLAPLFEATAASAAPPPALFPVA